MHHGTEDEDARFTMGFRARQKGSRTQYGQQCVGAMRSFGLMTVSRGGALCRLRINAMFFRVRKEASTPNYCLVRDQSFTHTGGPVLLEAVRVSSADPQLPAVLQRLGRTGRRGEAGGAELSC